MKILLDTHCWLWMLQAPERFNPQARQIVESPENTLFLSAASTWEIAIKHALGKLTLPMPPAEYVPSRMERSGVSGLAISITHTLQVARLPHHHRDPFDRLLIAQARADGLCLLSADAVFGNYDVKILRAD